jgi:hypothetical protein
MSKKINSGIVETAESWLNRNLSPTKAPTKYIAGYQTRTGKQLALERCRQNIMIWTEPYSAEPGTDNSVKVEHYDSIRPRNSNLKSRTPKLKTGKPAQYRTFKGFDEFQRFVSAYAGI